MFKDFNWSLLNSDSFKEDSVREELIAPLLRQLGYSASGENQICRSVPLTHPHVMIGSKRHQIKIVPDYTLKVKNKTRWILEAKAPSEPNDGESAEQAYSYAMHPDVRARYFAVCNGRRFAVYDVYELKPVLDFELATIAANWRKVTGLLGPDAFLREQRFTLKDMIKVVRQITAIIDATGELKFPISIKSVLNAFSVMLASQNGRYPIRVHVHAHDIIVPNISEIILRYNDSAEIHYSSFLNNCYRRFAVCNSLFSLVFPSERHLMLDRQESVKRAMEAFSALAPGVSVEDETDATLLQLLATIEILIPWRLRLSFDDNMLKKDVQPYDLAVQFLVPERFIWILLRGYRKHSDAIHRQLDSEFSQ